MERRTVLRTAVLGAGTAAFSGALWQEAFAAVAQPGPSPYGDLLPADANGLQVPGGFTTRVIARSGRRVGGTSYTWHCGGEGCWYDSGVCYFTTKGDNRVWAYDAVNERLDLAYDDSLVPAGAATLTGVDNITGASSGDLFVAEDGGNMEINVITSDGVVAPFLRILGQGSSEITGPAFSPDGRRLFFSSQRGTSGASTGSGGITYEVRGPFRT